MEKINNMKIGIAGEMKTYFLIVNLIVSIIAFSVLVSGQIEVGDDGVPPPGAGGTTDVDTGGDTGISDEEGGDGGGADVPGDEGGDVGDEGIGGGGGGGGLGGPGGGIIGGGGSILGGIGRVLKGINIQSLVTKAGLGASIFGTIGSMAGGDDGAKWGAISGVIGGAVAAVTEDLLGENYSMLLGLGVGAAVFVLTYKKTTEEIVEHYCLPWQPPIGGADCELCNDFEECSDYTCKSLGQACEIINPGTKEQKCIWKNPHDVNSPIIDFKKVNKGHKFVPDKSVRPPATGVKVTRKSVECIKAFTPLEFTFTTNEPAQCKIDYNLTASTKEDISAAFENMEYYVGGDTLFGYNHTEVLSLPGPDAINAIAPELKNDGVYTLYVRCQDANGNFNHDAFSVNFCVDPGPDVTPPMIVDVNIPSGNPVQFNQTDLKLEVYVNEPAKCRWSREDRDFENMGQEMKCKSNLWEMNNKNVYTCRTTLTGIEDRKENKYYFRCKDQPWRAEGDRNVNVQSYLYKVIGTQPLNILEVLPEEGDVISSSTKVIPVSLEIKTDNGYDDGTALCYYYNDGSNSAPESDEDYIMFLDTKSNIHKQRQDLVEGDYKYYFKCVDLGGNAVYDSTSFKVESDDDAPLVVRVYKESGELKIITSEAGECSYSIIDCNFEIDDGIQMSTLDSEAHNADWVINQNYHIRCKDKYNNQPNPNVCSIIVRPSKSEVNSVIEL